MEIENLGKNQLICKKHKRKKTFLCRRIEGCCCRGKRYCPLCIPKIQENQENQANKDDNSRSSESHHKFEILEEFLKEKYKEVKIDLYNYQIKYMYILMSLEERYIISLSVEKQLLRDVKLCAEWNEQLSEDRIEGRERQFHSDEMLERYMRMGKGFGMLKSCVGRVPFLRKNVEDIRGNKCGQLRFEGVERRFPKYLVVGGGRELLVYNQQKKKMSRYDLSMGVLLGGEIELAKGMKMANKAHIMNLGGDIIGIHKYRTLEVIENQVRKRKLVYKQAIKCVTPMIGERGNCLIQFQGRLELWSMHSFKCLKRFSHVLFNYFSNYCVHIPNTYSVICFSAFSILFINLLSGDMQHHVITHEYIKYSPNWMQQHIDILFIHILSQSIGDLRKHAIQQVKLLTPQHLLILYSDYVEVRALPSLSLIHSYQMVAEAVSIDKDKAIILAHTKSQTFVYILDPQSLKCDPTQKSQGEQDLQKNDQSLSTNPDDPSLRLLFSSPEIYAKLYYSLGKLYLFKHPYFQISNNNSNYNSLIIDIYN